jgi:hypothetical protein
LLKAGDYFHSNKHEVYLYNTVIGLATKSVYQSVIEKGIGIFLKLIFQNVTMLQNFFGFWLLCFLS